MRKRDLTIAGILLALIVLQGFLGFLVPAFNADSECWRPISSLVSSQELKEEGTAGDLSKSQLLLKVAPKYQMICDDVIFLRLLQKGFPQAYEEEPLLLTEPLYPFFMAAVLGLAEFFVDMGSLVNIFAAGIVVNLILLSVAIILFYFLVKDLLSSRKAGFISAFLLIFSPLTHIWLPQTTTTGILEVFIVVLSLWLLRQYVRLPTKSKLIIFSLVFGILMLGKMLYALAFFILFLGIYFRRYKETATFAVIQLVPLGLWYLFVKFGLGIPFYVHAVSDYDIGVWIFNIFSWPWYQTISIFMESIPRFFRALTFGFLFVPLVFSVYGLYRLQLKYKHLYYFGITGSFLLLFFIMNIYFPRLAFMIFPVVLPTAAYGLIKMPYARYLAPVIIIGLAIFGTVNIYNFVFYG